MPFLHPSDPSRRVYWGFILSSLILAFIYLRFFSYKKSRRESVFSTLSQFFTFRYWLNASTARDYQWFFINSVIKSGVLIPLVGGQLLLAMSVATFLQTTFDSPASADVPWWMIASLYTAVFFILEDASRFGLHWLMHKVPLLWRCHQVHHSATVLTPFTVYRVHPVEMALYFFRAVFVFGVVTGVFIYFFGAHLSGIDILGVDALGFLFNVFGANLRHSHIPVSFGRFERWFISPAQHQVHHSVDVNHHDKNFGTCLAIWDRLGSSWVDGREAENCQFGLSRERTMIYEGSS